MKKVQIKNKMKGLFGLFATLALAIGVGVTLAPRNILKTQAAETYTWTAANGIQTQFSSQTGTATLAGLDWSYTKSNASANVAWNTNAIQVGANGSPTGFIMSATLPSSYGAEVNKVTVETASYQGAHKFSISVGGTVLVEPKATASWTSTGSITTGDIPVGVNGIIELNWTVGTRATYIKSIAIEGRGPSASF